MIVAEVKLRQHDATVDVQVIEEIKKEGNKSGGRCRVGGKGLYHHCHHHHHLPAEQDMDQKLII